MKKGELIIAGWFAIINGVLQVPLAALYFTSGLSKQTEIDVAATIASALSTGIFVYVFFILKKLLNKGLAFSAVDVYINIFIALSIALTLLDFTSLFSKDIEGFIGMLSIPLLIVFGIIAIVFSIKLLPVAKEPYALFKPFSYLSIAEGFSYAVIILLPFAIIFGAISYILLGMIFFKAAGDKKIATV